MGTPYLIDTNVLVWLTQPGETVPAPVREALEPEDVRVYVSAASAFEVATKHRLGKFRIADTLVTEWSAIVRRLRAQELAVTSSHALRAGRLDWPHSDPFDRLIGAQALEEKLTLVSADRALLGLPGLSTLPWERRRR